MPPLGSSLPLLYKTKNDSRYKIGSEVRARQIKAAQGRKPERERHGFGGFLQNVAGDPFQFGKSVLYELPKAAAVGTAKTLADIQRAREGHPEEMKHTWSRLGRTALGFTDMIDVMTPSLGPIRTLEERQVFGRDASGKWKFWYVQKDPTDVAQAKESWYRDPLINALNVYPAIGAPARFG